MPIGGLGRGLSSLIPIKTQKKAVEEAENLERQVGVRREVLEINPDDIQVNPMQPRRTFAHADLEELVESIKEHGIIQPLIATRSGDKYELIAGERRLRSAKILGLTKVPVIIRDAKDQEKLELALIENIQRKNLNPLEEAISYARLVDEFSLTQEQAAKRLGKSRSKVANSLRLLLLPEEIQKAIEEGKISEGHAKVIAGFETENEQMSFFKKVLQHDLSVRDTENMAHKLSGAEKKKRKEGDYEIEAKSEVLRDILGTKVVVKKKGTGKGVVEIYFFSDEELDRLIEKFINSH